MRLARFSISGGAGWRQRAGRPQGGLPRGDREFGVYLQQPGVYPELASGTGGGKRSFGISAPGGYSTGIFYKTSCIAFFGIPNSRGDIPAPQMITRQALFQKQNDAFNTLFHSRRPRLPGLAQVIRHLEVHAKLRRCLEECPQSQRRVSGYSPFILQDRHLLKRRRFTNVLSTKGLLRAKQSQVIRKNQVIRLSGPRIGLPTGTTTAGGGRHHLLLDRREKRVQDGVFGHEHGRDPFGAGKMDRFHTLAMGIGGLSSSGVPSPGRTTKPIRSESIQRIPGEAERKHFRAALSSLSRGLNRLMQFKFGFA